MKFDYDAIERKVFCWINDIDTIMHTREVVNYAMIIAKAECPEALNDVLLAAYLHDILKPTLKGRHHAIQGALVIEDLLKVHFPGYNHRKILHAIRYHEDERITNDPAIGALWDAEHLANKRTNIDLFSTAKGIELTLNSEM